jgi:hypothetical protein
MYVTVITAQRICTSKIKKEEEEEVSYMIK